MNQKVTILIADDERSIRTGLKAIVERMLEQALVIGCVATGAQAMDILEKYHPDIAILDINMPEMDGLEVIRRAREQNLPTRFLILSGYEEFSYAQKAIRYGVKNYFLKPLNTEEFRAALLQQCQEVLAGRKSASSDLESLSRLVESSRVLFLNRLLHSRAVAGSAALETLPLNIHNGPNCVAVFLLERGDTPSTTLLREIVTPAFLGQAAECWLHEDDQIVVLMDMPAGAASCPDELRRKLIACAEEIRRRGTGVHVGLGDVAPDWSETSHSFARAQEALTYRIYSPDVKIYDTSLITSQRAAFSQDSIDFAPLIDAILEHDEEGIRTYCDAFFQALLYIKMPPPSFVVGMCMYLALNTQKQIQERLPNQPRDLRLSYEELTNYESLDEMRRWLCDFFTEYSEMLKDSDSSENRIIRMAKDYIRDNLSRNIKAKDVAARVNLSEAYFTIYFKEKTGVNFRDYLLGARIDQAKRLLRSGSANISEVAYRTGYQDYRSFSRAFKHETGMTPSEYQAKNKG